MSDPQTSADRFLAATYRPRHGAEPVEDDEYVAMLWRMVRALERRAIDRPELLAQTVALAQRLAEVVNVAVAANADRYAVDPRRGASMAECARILGITKQSASERRRRGAAVLDERARAAAATRFAEAARERAAIAAAADTAVTYLADWRARRGA
jgi:hypothetical protein